MARIMLVYPDGHTSYGVFDVDESGPAFTLGGARYTVEDMVNSGAVAVVNNPNLLRTMHDLKMPARPTAKQTTITISVAPDTRDRLKEASSATGRTVSNILEQIALDWLDQQNM